MKVYLGADHQGFALKNQLRDWLQAKKYDVIDVGPTELVPDDDYPDTGSAVSQAVAEDPANHRGIVLCGSGVGMAVVANKTIGVRAALIHDPAIAKQARADDDVNVLALGAAFVSFEQAKEIVDAWLATPFSGEARHQRRLKKISEYENGVGEGCDDEHCRC